MKALLSPKDLKEKDAETFVDNKITEVDNDTNTRLTRYTVLKNFYKGRQWDDDVLDSSYVSAETDYGLLYSRSRPEDMAEMTYNKCGPATDKFSQFLAITKLQFHVPKPVSYNEEFAGLTASEDATEQDDFEARRVDLIEKIGKTIYYKENDFKTISKRFSRDGAMLGDAMWSQKYSLNDKKIKLRREDPRKIILFWTDDSYDQAYVGVSIYQMALDEVKKPVEDGGLNKNGKLNNVKQEGPKYLQATTTNGQKMINIYDLWQLKRKDKNGVYSPLCRNIIKVGDTIIQDEEIEHPFPFYHARTIEVTGEPHGTSFVAPAIGIQREINERLSDEADIINYYAGPFILDINSGQDPKDIIGTTYGPKIIPLQEGGDMRFLEWGGNIYPIAQHIQLLLKAFDDIVGMPAIAYGVIDASMATGVALTASFQATIQKIMDWSENIGTQLERMWRDTMWLVERYGTEISGADIAKDIIQGHYEVKLEWGERAPRDESLYSTNIINQKNAGLMSDYTAMEKLSIPSPVDEQNRIAKEKNDARLHPETAVMKLQAATQAMQAEAQLKQMQAQSQQPPATPGANVMEGEAPMPGQPTASGSATPNLPPQMQGVPQPQAQPGEAGSSYQQPVRK